MIDNAQQAIERLQEQGISTNLSPTETLEYVLDLLSETQTRLDELGRPDGYSMTFQAESLYMMKDDLSDLAAYFENMLDGVFPTA